MMHLTHTRHLVRALSALLCGVLLIGPRLQARAQPATASSIAPAGPAAPARKTVVVLGDSLAAGYGLDPSLAFPALIQKRIDEQAWPFTVVNAGVSGDTSSGGLRRVEWLLKRRVDVLVLELGANDGLRGLPLSITRSNLQSIIDRTRKKNPGARIVIAGMQLPPNMGGEYAEAFRQMFSDLAQTNQAALIPFLLDGVGGRPELNLADRIHPTMEGHRIVAQNVWKTLKPVLEELSRGDEAQTPRE